MQTLEEAVSSAYDAELARAEAAMGDVRCRACGECGLFGPRTSWQVGAADEARLEALGAGVCRLRMGGEVTTARAEACEGFEPRD